MANNNANNKNVYRSDDKIAYDELAAYYDKADNDYSDLKRMELYRDPNKYVSNELSTIEKVLIKILNEHKLKITTPRMLVLNRFVEKNIPMTAEGLRKNLSALSPGRATVYRILKQAVEVGIAREIHYKGGVIYFESTIDPEKLTVSEGNHCHHVICKSCGKVDHVDTSSVEEGLLKLSQDINGFTSIDSHSLDFFGFCANCPPSEAMTLVPAANKHK